ncbi:MAG: polynucleotide adenylyltransferase PcnB [Candidatus Protistobacter heckmanni]|nr:polynucleotide adenylyltransferase PcnB [Candidatus Protistobacter heckmanni]
MITKLIRKLFGQDGEAAAKSEKPAKGRGKGGSSLRSEAKIIEASKHHIDPSLISRNAVKVTSTLQQAGHQAFIVGGAVRDLLLGIAPKDFDVATSATPEQVTALFRRSRLIGRRFQIVHVNFYGGREQEIIEVSTFRALVDADASAQVPNLAAGKRGRKGELDAHSHATNASGRVLRDNVWGSQAEDAARRDFTINAMYYDPATQTVHDYHGGMADMRARTLRMIGDPVTRYREDPVRMLRVVRFAAKTGFTIEPDTDAPIPQLANLIHDVPSSRLFDEMLKLLLSGHAWASMQQLRQAGLQEGLLPLLDVVLEQPMGERFVQLSLANTDRRIAAGKPVSPGFLFASLLWHQVLERWNVRKAAGETPIPSLHAAMDDVLDSQTEKLAIQRRHVGDMKEIWSMQPRFERIGGRMPLRLLEAQRFRAGYDFLRLRCESGELPEALGKWWTDFQDADPDEREELLKTGRQIEGSGGGAAAGGSGCKRRPRRKRSGENSATLAPKTDPESGPSSEGNVQ